MAKALGHIRSGDAGGWEGGKRRFAKHWQTIRWIARPSEGATAKGVWQGSLVDYIPIHYYLLLWQSEAEDRSWDGSTRCLATTAMTMHRHARAAGAIEASGIEPGQSISRARSLWPCATGVYFRGIPKRLELALFDPFGRVLIVEL